MNLILLVVWCGFLSSCTISLPRKRQIRYPVTKSQNSHHHRSRPTALEVLERTLLRPGGRKRRHFPTRSGGKRSTQLCNERLTSEGAIDRCVASFGDISPLCKPKTRRKKSFVGIPDFHKRLFRSDTGARQNMTITTSNSFVDFFGIFSSPDAPFNDNAKVISKFDVSPLVGTTDAVSPNSTAVRLTESSKITTDGISSPVTSTQVSTIPQSIFQPTNINVGKYSSTESGNAVVKQEANKIILPGIVQKIESGPQYLYLEEANSPKMGEKDGSYIKALEEVEGVNVTTDLSVSPTAEGSSETPSAETPSAETTTAETTTVRTTRLTLPPLKNSFLTGSTYSKTQCESEKKKKCICSFASVDSDFQTIFSKAKNEEEVLAEVASMKCRQYKPQPSVFDLNTNAKPRVLKGKHTPFAVDNRQGAKEVTESSLDEFIAYSALDDGITRVFVSTDVKLPCFPRPDIHLSATDADHVKFTWTYGNRKQELTQGRITESPDGDGSLKIQDVELTDAMNYTCEIDYIHPDTGERTTDAFTHSLEVVTLPIVSARAKVHYKSTAACDESLLEMFEMYLPQTVEQTVCTPDGKRPQLCNVVVHSPVCHSEGQEGKSKREVGEIPTYCYREKREKASMEMSLNYDVFIHRTAAKALPQGKTTVCDPDCHLLMNFKLLQMFKESVQEVAMIPIVSKVQGGGTFTPVPSSVKVKYIFGCIGGYYLDNGFCLACPKGMYSDDGATECQQCPLHTYSTTVGARKCTPCRYLWMPICNEYFESMNIKMIFSVIFVVVLLLVSFIVYYVFFYKGQTWKDVLKKGPKEKIAKSERIRSRKEAKRAREEQEAILKKAKKEAERAAKVKSEEEMRRLVLTSEESATESEPEFIKHEKQVAIHAK